MESKARKHRRIKNVFEDDSRMIPARKLENRGIGEKLRVYIYTYIYVCVCFKRCEE